MNHTLKTRSALVRSAESGLRRQQRRESSAFVFAVCAMVIGVYLVAAFIGGVLA